MSADEQTRFLTRLAEDLNSRDIRLPSFPDVVVNIRKALEDPACTSERLAGVVRTDPILAARLLKAANSAFHNRAGIEIVDLDLAISRLGFEVVRNTAITLAVEQLFNAREYADLRDSLRVIWESSVALSSMCFVIARRHGKLNADDAYLCGLLNGVGELYLLTRAREYPALMGDPAAFETIVREWNPGVGRSIVKAWGFSEEIANCFDIDENLSQDQRAPATLVDVVFAAGRVLDEGDAALDGAAQLAAGKLGVTTDSLPALREAYALHSSSVRHAAAA